MKILHTADWHLGKRLEGHSRLPEQVEVLDEICRIAEEQKVDAVLIAGDIFDHFNPSTEAVHLFYKTIHRLGDRGHRLVFAIAGNHDSPERIEAPDPLARYNGIVLLGYPHTELPPFTSEHGIQISKSAPGVTEFILPEMDYPLRIFHTPYANELRLKTYLKQDDEKALRELLHNNWEAQVADFADDKGVNILIAHLLFTTRGSQIPVEPDDEKPILHIGGASAVYTEDIPPAIQYTALGHLHRKQSIDDRHGPVMYSGSPLSYSFAEANQDKYVLIVELEPGAKARVSPVRLSSGKRLLRKRFESVDDAAQWLQKHPGIWVELTMVSEGYLKAEDRKRLEEHHSGITVIIPEVKLREGAQASNPAAELSLSRTELFERFFVHKTGQKPNEDILDLFNEIIQNVPVK